MIQDKCLISWDTILPHEITPNKNLAEKENNKRKYVKEFDPIIKVYIQLRKIITKHNNCRVTKEFLYDIKDEELKRKASQEHYKIVKNYQEKKLNKIIYYKEVINIISKYKKITKNSLKSFPVLSNLRKELRLLKKKYKELSV